MKFRNYVYSYLVINTHIFKYFKNCVASSLKDKNISIAIDYELTELYRLLYLQHYNV